MTSEDWLYVARFICDGDGSKIIQGDQLESASAYDPSFWVIHPLLERAFHLRLLVGGRGYESFQWPAGASDVCQKATCFFDNFGKNTHDICCRGHYASDRTFDFLRGVRAAAFGSTNLEVYKATDASAANYSNSHIYDSFTWKHCEDVGISLTPSAHSPQSA
jgi:hypothetical protein